MMKSHESQQTAPIIATIAMIIGSKLKNHIENSFDGKQIKSCPKTIPTILKIHNNAEAKGVMLEDPRWLDQDPYGNLCDAELLPNLNSESNERKLN